MVVAELKIRQSVAQRPYSPWPRSGGRRDGIWYQDSDTLLGRTSTGRGCQLPAWMGGTGTRIQYAALGCGASVAVGSSQMAKSTGLLGLAMNLETSP